jgi:hypothetical protein
MLLNDVTNKLRIRLLYTNHIGPVLSRLQHNDDYQWASYSKGKYGPLLTEFESHFCARLADTKWEVCDGKLMVSGRPLHPNHQLIYELAVRLAPASLFECGFGGGDHLANLSLLLPKASIGGADISHDQRALALERNGESLRSATLHVLDVTRVNKKSRLYGTAEFVYCQAVIMHIHGGDRHLKFMRSMWDISSRYMLLVEDWRRHDFVRDLHVLFPNCALYCVATRHSAGILIDKKNAMLLPVVRSDREMRRHIRLG